MKNKIDEVEKVFEEELHLKRKLSMFYQNINSVLNNNIAFKFQKYAFLLIDQTIILHILIKLLNRAWPTTIMSYLTSSFSLLQDDDIKGKNQ